MSDAAHRTIALIVRDMEQALPPKPLPGLDLADLTVIFRDDGGRAAVGVGEASGDDRVEQAVAHALQDLAAQLRRLREPETGTPPDGVGGAT
jgi:cell division GTPase FtsZ